MTAVNDITVEQLNIIRQHLNEVPVKISALGAALGLKIKVATLPPGISGEIRPDPDAKAGFKIRVNRHEAKSRQRFTVAHEIAHFLLHRSYIGEGLEDTVLYRSRLSSDIEASANRLAADLLMPRDAVEFEVRNSVGVDVEQLVATLSEKFEVSPAAMRIRIGDR